VAQWSLKRTKSDSDIRSPFSKEHPLIVAADEASAVFTAKKQEQKSPEINNGWISQVEIATYSGPARRLWLGPQFTFKTYISPQQSAALLTAGGDERVNRSAPMSMPGRIRPNTVPVVIDATAFGSFEQSPGMALEVCGSWSSVSGDETEQKLRRKLQEAMLDQPHAGRISMDSGMPGGTTTACLIDCEDGSEGGAWCEAESGSIGSRDEDDDKDHGLFMPALDS